MFVALNPCDVALMIALPGAAAVTKPDVETDTAVRFELSHEIAAPLTTL
jgi:hypothetical protein